jgi:hypothetical protein
MKSIAEVFQAWPSTAAAARDFGLPYEMVCKWRQRGRIPAHAWRDVVAAARRRGKRLTHETLQRINPPRVNGSR